MVKGTNVYMAMLKGWQLFNANRRTILDKGNLATIQNIERLNLPVHSSSILLNCALRQSFTHDSMSCLDRFSVVTFVE